MSNNRWDKKEFLSLPVKEQLEFLFTFLVEIKLEELEAEISYRLDPESLDKQIALSFLNSPVFHFIEYWIVNEALDDEAYRKALLKNINDWKIKFGGSK